MLIAALLSLTASCTTVSSATDRGPVYQALCDQFQPLRASRLDTEETKRQVIAHNATWVALCEKTP